MIVIADTGPINYLILIGEIEILPALFQRILVPPSVCGELNRARAPDAVRTWIAEPPVWLEIRKPSRSPGADLARLGAGERDAILLAEELGDDQIIIDEFRGRREAKRRQIPYTGTLGRFGGGIGQGLLDLRRAMERLRLTSFRPLFHFLGTPCKDKKQVVYEDGHGAFPPEAVRESLDWLDKYLGPVRR
jgi:predicted nucleic acid-binding protein